jgi:ketosteroid isomerase-like protein
MIISRLVLFATVLAAGASSCRQSAPERDTSADQQSVSQVGERELSAFSAGDIDGNLATLTQDVVMMPPNEQLLTGSAGVRSWLRRVHDQFTINARYTESHVDVAGDWAIQRYVGVGTITPKKGGSPIEERFKGIHIYRRQPDGSWRIAQDIWNSDSSPPAHP